MGVKFNVTGRCEGMLTPAKVIAPACMACQRRDDPRTSDAVHWVAAPERLPCEMRIAPEFDPGRRVVEL